MSKSYFVLIPFKGLEGAKTRLDYADTRDGFLYPDERQSLALNLVTDVYRVWTEAIGSGGNVTVGLMKDILGETRQRLENNRIKVVPMPSEDINESMRHYGQQAFRDGYERYAVGGSDLPLLTVGDVRMLQETSEKYTRNFSGVVLSEGDLGGTTYYVITPPTAYEIELYAHGRSNLENQLARFAALRIRYDLMWTRNLFLDIDYPEDLIQLLVAFNVGAKVYCNRETFKFLMPLFNQLTNENSDRGERFRNLLNRAQHLKVK